MRFVTFHRLVNSSEDCGESVSPHEREPLALKPIRDTNMTIPTSTGPGAEGRPLDAAHVEIFGRVFAAS
jgi:hypothetical protein